MSWERGGRDAISKERRDVRRVREGEVRCEGVRDVIDVIMLWVFEGRGAGREAGGRCERFWLSVDSSSSPSSAAVVRGGFAGLVVDAASSAKGRCGGDEGGDMGDGGVVGRSRRSRFLRNRSATSSMVAGL